MVIVIMTMTMITIVIVEGIMMIKMMKGRIMVMMMTVYHH